ncbi:LysR substrate-binding domain-containing protein [Nitratireductor sp. StC3]|uniref:LysR substrate-binding domain-containing protein n=1 Tax=Nitratireductor sp. StC3 TaxID=2126741 RepID=UPI000D0E178F|nr:LysR substrate-binding domain-containing protein [Nitratireductor sp. StC3]PSM19705.1 LysR family transcriptional regulator [Nitratireductor sp. StC3]
MRFRHYDALRTFVTVAIEGSFTSAAADLGLTKGAVSHQLRTLEDQLGFKVFERMPRGVMLTEKGEALFDVARVAFGAIDRQIDGLRADGRRSVTLGLSTYLASRWLSSRLMDFLHTHPAIRLRLQPTIDLHHLQRDGIDIAIRWGRGEWTDMASERLFSCPAFPAVAPKVLDALGTDEPARVLTRLPLLHDRDDSRAWRDWFAVAGLSLDDRATTLTIRDPNVRVQAVIDGQGIALFDRFVEAELAAGLLQRLSPHMLEEYGYYLAFPPGSLANPDVASLAGWLREAAKQGSPT